MIVKGIKSTLFVLLRNIQKILTTSAILYVAAIQSVSRVQLCDSKDCSTPGFPVLHYPPEFAQTNVPQVSDAIQPSQALLYMPSVNTAS